MLFLIARRRLDLLILRCIGWIGREREGERERVGETNKEGKRRSAWCNK